MCRHLAYIGPPLALHELLFGAPHGLAAQAREPRHQNPPEHNADGWGVGWYPDDGAPCRHLSPAPVFADDGFTATAARVRSGAVLAAARRASPGATIDVTGNAPFVSGRWLFSLNGIVHGFYDGVGEALRRGLSPGRRDTFDGDADSEVLFAMALDRMDGGAAPGEALVRTIAAVTRRTTGRFNLLLTDGRRVAATACGNSLFFRDADGALTVASEPLDDDPKWRRVPDGSLVESGPPVRTSRLEECA